MCIFALLMRIDMSRLNTYRITATLLKIGSTKNGTVHNDDFLAAVKKRLYLCSAFEIQMPEIEY